MKQHEREQRYITVPVIPSEAMMMNGSVCQHHAHDDLTCVQRDMRRGIWDKMIAAAPAQPTPLMTDLSVQMANEVAALRQIISRAATACGAAVSPECSIGFMEHLPAEIESVIARQKAVISDYQQGAKAEADAGDEARHEATEMRERFKYWQQRARSAEGHLWASDFQAACDAVHKISNYSDIATDALSVQQKAAIAQAVNAVLVSVNVRRDERRPHDSQDLAWCACGDGYPQADLDELGGVCENCRAARGAVAAEAVQFPREMTDEIGELIAERARVCGGGAFDFWEALCERFGAPASTVTQSLGASVSNITTNLTRQEE